MYGGSQASSKDMNLLFPSSTAFKNSNSGGGGGGGGGGDLQRTNSMDVNLLLHQQQHHHHHHHHQRPQHQQQQQQQQQQQHMNTGLMRYRSAPSSLIANFIDGDSEVEGCDDFIPTSVPPPHRSSSPEAETMFARFMSSGGSGGGGDSGSPDLSSIGEKPTINNRNPQFMTSMEQETEQNGFPPASQMMFQTPLPPPPSQPPPPPLPMQNQSSNSTENSYRVGNSMGMDQQQQHHSQLKMGNSTNTSNLIRHSSSPAGLFSHLSVENGFAVMRGIGNYRAGNGTNGEAAATNSRLKGQMTFSSRQPTSTGLMSQISEIESESMGGSSADEGSFGNSSGTGTRFMPSGGFPVASWDDPSLENFPSLKRSRDINGKMIPGLNSSENQNGEGGNHTTGLTHHFSLPKNSAEMAAILQFQDSVPCKIRAKRGCATHPRSIAERVRRTRISERMRKLQELVPNMDKQTNTADMLDLAVDYIKDLQKQVKSLNDNRANCTCANKLKA